MNTVCVFSLLLMTAGVLVGQTPLGVFSDQADIGSVQHPGSATFDSSSGTYTISGGGANMWFTNDAFHFVWKKMSGDVRFSADIRWPDTNGNPHRKACLLIRENLESNSAYADAAAHGSGLTSLQYRSANGETTREIQSNLSAPARLGIEKRGNYVSLWVGAPGEPLHPAGGAFRIQLPDSFYLGLGVCAHDDNALAQATFSNVEITELPPATGSPISGASTLEVVPIGSKDRRVIYQTTNHIEAPNWSRDGQYFIFNSGGHLFKLPVTGGGPQKIDTGFANKCNNDHGISPDGTLLAISDQSQGGKSMVYTLPIDGGTPTRITPTGPSYWHGWSPDGKTLAFCGERDGEFDVYTIPAAGGPERRLTTAPGLDDGPDYSPDGKFIYFNSVRSGSMQIWRMTAEGHDQEQITTDDYNNWFAHPSPDGKWIAFISYPKDTDGHPANKDVVLRLRNIATGKIEELARLFGGQGTINVPSWSPDSKQIAFVSYQPVYH